MTGISGMSGMGITIQDGVTSINSKSGAITLESTGGSVTITTPDSSHINLEVAAGGAIIEGNAAIGGGTAGAGGTLINILDTVSFWDYFPNDNVSGTDYTADFQTFLRMANLLALTLRNQTSDSTIASGVVRVVCPRFEIGLSSPLVVPEYVALDMPGTDFRRLGSTGQYHTAVNSDYTSGGGTMVVASVSGLLATPFYIRVGNEILQVTGNAGTTLNVTGAQLGTSAANHLAATAVNSIFTTYNGDTATKSFTNLCLPTLIFVPHSHNLSIVQPYCNSTGTDRGSGIFAGKNWLPSTATKVSGGTGYTVNDVLTMAQPSAASYVAPQITVNSVDGSGVILTFTLTRFGSYALPPVLQNLQWTVANGFTGSIAAGNKGKVFTADGSGVFVTSGGTGTGATFSIGWTADFVLNGTDYQYGAFIESNMYLGDVAVAQSTTSATVDPTFGHTFCLGIGGLQYVMREVTTGFGQYGVWFSGCTDCFWQNLNPVDAVTTAIRIGSGGGSLRGLVTIDTPAGSAIWQDIADNVNLWGDVFSASTSDLTGSGGAIVLGGNGGGVATLNSNVNYDLSFYGIGKAAGFPAMSIANTIDSNFRFKIANKGKAGTAKTPLTTSFAAFGSNVTNCTISGSIEGATSITSGTIDPTVSINTWDATAKQRVTKENLLLSTGYVESTVFANGNSGTSFALNLDNGPLQSITISGAVAITQTTPTNPGKYTIVITQDGSGHIYSLAGIKWVGGSPPAYSTAASKIDAISLIWDGTNFYGMAGIAFA